MDPPSSFHDEIIAVGNNGRNKNGMDPPSSLAYGRNKNGMDPPSSLDARKLNIVDESIG